MQNECFHKHCVKVFPRKVFTAGKLIDECRFLGEDLILEGSSGVCPGTGCTKECLNVAICVWKMDEKK